MDVFGAFFDDEVGQWVFGSIVTNDIPHALAVWLNNPDMFRWQVLTTDAQYRKYRGMVRLLLHYRSIANHPLSREECDLLIEERRLSKQEIDSCQEV